MISISQRISFGEGCNYHHLWKQNCRRRGERNVFSDSSVSVTQESCKKKHQFWCAHHQHWPCQIRLEKNRIPSLEQRLSTEAVTILSYLRINFVQINLEKRITAIVDFQGRNTHILLKANAVCLSVKPHM